MRSGGWRLQKLPRGVLGAAPRACVANPTSRVCPAPFSTQSLPRPLARGSSYPPPALLLFLSPSISLWRAPGTQGRPREDSLGGAARGETRPRRCGRSPGCCWRRLAPAGSQPKRRVCQALPGVKSGQLETSGDGRGRTGLASAAASVATNTHTTSHTCSQCVNQNGE